MELIKIQLARKRKRKLEEHHQQIVSYVNKHYVIPCNVTLYGPPVSLGKLNYKDKVVWIVINMVNAKLFKDWIVGSLSFMYRVDYETQESEIFLYCSSVYNIDYYI